MEDIIEIHYIELPKFRKRLSKGNLDLNDSLIRILLLLNKSTSPDLMEKVMNMDESVSKMYEKTLHVLQDQKEYLAYIRAEQAELDEKAQIKYAVDEGKEERELEIAIKLKNEGIPFETIANATGLPLEKIKKL